MQKLIKYFYPREEQSYFDRLKAGLFIKICVFGVLLLSVFSITDIILYNDNFLVSFSSKLFTLLLLIVFLFLLKQNGIRKTGNQFSLIMLCILLVFVNILPSEVNPITKFIEGFYSVYAYVIFALIFSSRRILIINSILIFLSTTSVFIRSILFFEIDNSLFTDSYINHTFILIVLTFIAYYLSKFTEATIQKAEEQLRIHELKNQELLASEEEIRASNEELVATTDALVESNKELLIAKERAEESDKLKTEFLNNMSHEVRTPMNGIIGFAQLLEIPDLEDEKRNFYTGLIKESSNQLLSILDNIIEISKLGSERIQVVEQEINLNKLLLSLKDTFQVTASSKNLNVNVNNELYENQYLILTDEFKLNKILCSILDNAFKFTEKGGVELTCSLFKAENKEQIKFSIKDTGIGVPKEKQEKIFNKFLQAEGHLSRMYGGLGLGLSIVKENLKLLNGEIYLNSDRGKGSEFIVLIPFKQKEKPLK